LLPRARKKFLFEALPLCSKFGVQHKPAFNEWQSLADMYLITPGYWKSIFSALQCVGNAQANRRSIWIVT
jgi:hypothetical protein